MSNLKKQLKPLFFHVWKEKAQAQDSFPVSFSSHLDHWIVAETPDGPLVVNSCSKNYGLITNEDMLLPLIELMESKYENMDARASIWGWSKFYVDFIFRDIDMKIQKNDHIFPRVRWNNSYDGTVRYQFYFGFWRKICENGATAPVLDAEHGDIKMRHTPGNAKEAASKTMAMIEVFLQEAPKIMKGYEELVKGKVSWDDAINVVNDVIDGVSKYPRKKEEEIMARMQEEVDLGLPINYWMVYNALNYVLYKSDSQMKPHKRDVVDGQVLEFLLNYLN